MTHLAHSPSYLISCSSVQWQKKIWLGELKGCSPARDTIELHQIMFLETNLSCIMHLDGCYSSKFLQNFEKKAVRSTSKEFRRVPSLKMHHDWATPSFEGLKFSIKQLGKTNNVDSMYFQTLIPNHPTHDIGLKCSPSEISLKKVDN